MRTIRNQTNKVVWHCSATKPDWNGHAADIAAMHKARGWDDIGYHIVISREGGIQWGENPRRRGAHAKGHNTDSIAVCLVGGVDANGKAENNFTPDQWASAKDTYVFLSRVYPDADHVGHRDLSDDADGDGRIMRHEFMKDCPCFSVAQWEENNLDPVSDLYAPWETDPSEDVPDVEPEDEAVEDDDFGEWPAELADDGDDDAGADEDNDDS